MSITIVLMVQVPLNSDGGYDSDALHTYLMLVVVHAVMYTQIRYNHYYADEYPQIMALTNVVLMMVQVMV